jgi:hypothetical protein
MIGGFVYMKRKKWIILASVVVLAGLVFYWGSSANPAGDAEGYAPQTLAGGANDATENWVKVATLSGTVDQRESEPFKLKGGEVKIVSRIVATDSGGNGLVYLLPEGATTSSGVDGNIRVASFDQSIISISDAEVERSVITHKEAGSWYIHFNSTKLAEWIVDIYELI